MDHNEENNQFWSSILQSLADSNPIYHLYPEIDRPRMVMSTTMSIDVTPEPKASLGDGDKVAGPEKTTVENGSETISESEKKSTKKPIDEEMEEDANDTKKLGKRPRSCNESLCINYKRRRADIRDKMEMLMELLHCNSKLRDTQPTLDFIIDRTRELKYFVEVMQYNLYVSHMMPMAMPMDYPTPWIPYWPPNQFMMPFNGHNQQIAHLTTKGFNNQPHESKSK